MKRIYLLAFLIITVLFSCKKTETRVELNIEANLKFSGSYRLTSADDVTGPCSLHIANGYYECSTNPPFGRGAGKLETTKTTINFVDTLFLIIPAMYVSYAPHGKHNYEFDGVNLTIWRESNIGNFEYDLKLTEKN
jgi:hypothetical protein